MKPELHILHLEDNPKDTELIRSMLEADGLHCRVDCVKNRSDFEAALERHATAPFDLVISDFTLPAFDGLSALALAREKCPDTPFIFVSGTIGEDAAIESLKRGAADYVLKDRLSRLPVAVERALREAAERTERKEFEARLLHAQRLEAIGALAGGIAHDLNNALAPILMGIECLDGERLTDGGRQMLELMKTSTLRSAQMVKQVLSSARGVGGSPRLLDLKPLIYEMEQLARETFPRAIRIQTRVSSPLHSVLGNATQLHQVLLNLCINARDAMPEGGSLCIEAGNIALAQKLFRGEPRPISGNFVALTVSDTGQGIPLELHDRIFEPFFTTKTPDQGTGLGLTTVRGIVKTHGGFLEMDSKVGKGTTFRLYCPATIPTEVRPPKIEPDGPALGKGEQILLVDDEVALLRTMREVLESSHYRVLTANHGGEALALCRQHKSEIQGVITDLMMPCMDGPTLIRALQQIDPTIKILGITGLSPESALAKAGKLAVHAYLEKPFSIEDLLRTLRRALGQSGEPLSA